jgi:hypothetical protein
MSWWKGKEKRERSAAESRLRGSKVLQVCCAGGSSAHELKGAEEKPLPFAEIE